MELLAVIGVIVILMAIAIPAMRFDMKDRNVREASRAVNAYMVAAQSLAAERNRPVGVWFERRNGSPGECIRLFTAEVPPPYIGDTPLARAQVSPGAGSFRVTFPLVGGQQHSSLIRSLVQRGDVIRFDYKGPYYRIVSDPTALTLGQPPILAIVLDGQSPPASFRAAVPFQILRAARKTSIASIELPKTASIDLNVSGLGPIQGNTLFNPSGANDVTPVVIMFSPSGRIDHVRVQGQAVIPEETVHLLIGREELVDLTNRSKNLGGDGVQEEEKDAMTNLWVSIGAHTGSITTQEMATTPNVPAAQLPQRVQRSRAYANRKHLMGGG